VRWRPTGRSQVEDRRGQSSGGGGLGGMPMPGRLGGGAGCLGVVVLILVVVLGGGNLLSSGGGNAFDVGLQPLPEAPTADTSQPLPGAPDEDRERQFVEFVVDNVQTTWDDLFRQAGQQYRPTTLVLFSGGTSTGCGQASSATGPFYCPADLKVYLDLGFFRELQRRFGAPGDFAQAYVIAHEFGHHVQRITGIEGRVRELQQENPGDRNELSVRLELQADCFAGVWAHSAYRQDILEPGDIEEGLTAAAAVGDDRIQAQTSGRIDPESWTHGSAEQRQHWFQEGFQDGDPNDCDTFQDDDV
jgi:predicted metalloprotease